MGDTGQPPPGGGEKSTNTSLSNLQTSGPTSTTSAWAGGAGPAGLARKQRSFAEIISEERRNRNILEITLTKMTTTDPATGRTHTRKNLSFDEIGAFLFEVLKIKPSDCLRFNYTSGRYDTREVMFKPGIDLEPFTGSFQYLEHEIICKKQRSNISKITFKNVPLNIPDEEIVNLCETYGKPTDYIVHYEKMHNDKNRGMVGSTRSLEVELFPGASMFNYYWMEGPLVGDIGCRVTVLHAGQIPQCYNCLQLATMGCPGKGNGKACAALGTTKTRLEMYMNMVKTKHGYSSLKQKYFEQNPIPGGAGNFGISEREDSIEDSDIVPMNPIEEKDLQLSNLQQALEESRKEVQDIVSLKESLVKTKTELRAAKKSSILAKSKVDLARKVTEQRIIQSLPNLTSDIEEDLVSLYSNLVDEESFTLDDNSIVPNDDFLSHVEDRVKDNTKEMEKLKHLKAKILENIKQKKISKQKFRDRRESVSSVCSTSSKRAMCEDLEPTERAKQGKLDISLVKS